MPDTFMTRPLSRSTSILKVRDRLNSLMGHSLDGDEDENICFEAPAARTLFQTHEDCLIYKYLLYRDRYKSKVHVLYFKWWLWFEDEKGGRMEELIETAGQLEIKMKDIHRTFQTAANEGKVLSTHIMRMGIEPLPSSPLLEHGDCITLRADIGCAVPFFDSVAHLLLKDELYYPADMSIPLVGVSICVQSPYAVITIWIPPRPHQVEQLHWKYKPDDIYAVVDKIAERTNSKEIMHTAHLVDNDTGETTSIFAQGPE